LSIRRAPRSGARGRSRTARRTGSPITWFVSRADPAAPAGPALQAGPPNVPDAPPGLL